MTSFGDIGQGGISQPYSLANWAARRPLPEGKTIEQLTLWERYYYGRVDYPTDAKDYGLYCRWFEFVRRCDAAKVAAETATNPIDQWVAFEDAAMWERMAAAMLRGHVESTNPSAKERRRIFDEERAARDKDTAAKEKVWQQKIWETLKDSM